MILQIMQLRSFIVFSTNHSNWNPPHFSIVIVSCSRLSLQFLSSCFILSTYRYCALFIKPRRSSSWWVYIENLFRCIQELTRSRFSLGVEIRLLILAITRKWSESTLAPRKVRTSKMFDACINSYVVDLVFTSLVRWDPGCLMNLWMWKIRTANN